MLIVQSLLTLILVALVLLVLLIDTKMDRANRTLRHIREDLNLQHSELEDIHLTLRDATTSKRRRKAERRARKAGRAIAKFLVTSLVQIASASKDSTAPKQDNAGAGPNPNETAVR